MGMYKISLYQLFKNYYKWFFNFLKVLLNFVKCLIFFQQYFYIKNTIQR